MDEITAFSCQNSFQLGWPHFSCIGSSATFDWLHDLSGSIWVLTGAITISAAFIPAFLTKSVHMVGETIPRWVKHVHLGPILGFQ